MKRILVIDDLRKFEPLPDEEITTCRDLVSGTDKLTQDGPWDEVWLDHDLGIVDGLKSTIRILVGAIEAEAHNGHLYDVGMFVILTDNPIGRKWMIDALSPHYPVEVGKRDYSIDWGG